MIATIDAVLFDLDDTLLGNNSDEFLPHYFSALSEYVRPFLGRDKFMSELMYSTQEMINDSDSSRTNREVFWAVFCQRTGLAQDTFEPFINKFYQETFPNLRGVAKRIPIALEIVSYCIDRRLKVVVATNPLFPLLAIEHRLQWAGVPAELMDYSLITSYEVMHSTKPNLSYYEEVLDIIGCEPERALMVGDDWINDMVPARQLGLFTYWINHSKSVGTRISLVDDYGTLEDLHNLLKSGWLSKPS